MNAESILQRARVLLGDIQAVKFNDIQLETALAQVMAHLNTKVPHVITLEFSETPDHHVLQLPETEGMYNVVSLLCLDFNPPAKIAFHFDGNNPAQLEIMADLPNNEMQWQLKGVENHRIEGMDGAVSSTIPGYCEMLLASGTAAYALQIRNTQLSESANQETAHFQALYQNIQIFEEQFRSLLAGWQAAQPEIEPAFSDAESWPLD